MRYLINADNNSRAARPARDRPIIIIRPNRKQPQPCAAAAVAAAAAPRIRAGVTLAIVTGNFPLVDLTTPPRKEWRVTVPLICHGSDRLRDRDAASRARAQPLLRLRSGFHNANYDRFVLPLRKCSSQRHRASRRLLRALKLCSLCPGFCVHFVYLRISSRASV